MFEQVMQRPADYFRLPEQQQWEIDSALGILDWDEKMTAVQQERFNARFKVNVSSDKQSADIYVPADLEKGFRDIRPGSAIVGVPSGSDVKIYYEGNLYGAPNLHDSHERIVCAAGRLFHRYPTVARMNVPGDAMGGLVRVGTIDPSFRVEIEDEATAKQWFSQYKEAR